MENMRVRSMTRSKDRMTRHRPERHPEDLPESIADTRAQVHEAQQIPSKINKTFHPDATMDLKNTNKGKISLPKTAVQ